MATADPSIFNDLLQKLIGSQTNTSTDEQLGTTNNINTGVTGTQGTTQQATGATSSTQQSNANVSDLQKVFAQQQAGITPDLLHSIFFEGAKQVPGLVAANANAVGARSGSNSPLSLGLQNLDSNLASQAAQINASLLNASGNTAAQIAELTKGVTTAGTTQQGTTGTTNTAQNTATNQVQNSTDAKDTVQRQTINAQSTALTAGAALLASLLKNGGSAGSIGDLITKLFGGGGVGGNTGSNPFDPSAGGFLTGGNTPDIFTNPGNINADTGGSVISDPGSLTNWTDPTLGGLFGWADGGIVPTPQLSIGSGDKRQATAINPAALLAGGANGTSLGSSGSSGNSSGSDLASVFGSLGLDQGGGSTNAPGAGVGLASPTVGNAVGSAIGHNVLGMVVNAALTAALGPVGGLVGGIVKQMLTPTPTPNTAPGAVGGGVSAASPTGSVSVGQATGVATDNGQAIGVSMGAPGVGDSDDGGSANTGDGNAAGSADGGTGDSGGDGDGGGYADGGMLPKQSNDKKGIRDTLMIPVSGGEYVMPSDVMKHPAVLPLLELIRNSLHTPAMQQEPA